MRGALGEKIGEGATADLHAWAPGQVVKLFKADRPRRFGEHEARMTRAVFAAGASAPEVLGEVTLDGRFGIVLRRLDGPTLQQLLLTRAMTSEQAGEILATLYISVHKTPPPPDVLSLRDWFYYASRVPDGIPKHIATGVLTLIERLPPGGGLCHADLNPGNVIMTADGPRLIDWMWATHAPAAFDLGWLRICLTELALDIADNPQRPLAVHAAAQSEYARLAGLSQAALTEAIETWLPIVIVRWFVLFGGPKTARWERLMQQAEAALRPPD